LARRRPARRRFVIAASSAALVLVAACSPRPTSEVGTTIVDPRGTCDTSRVVEVGATLPLSGSSASLAKEYLAGLQLAVRHVNRGGGVLGSNRCLELAYKDDRGDPQIARRAVLDLVDHETVAFLVGPTLPSQIQAAGTGLARAGIPTGGLSSLDATFRPARYPWMFPLAASNQTLATAMAAYASSQGWSRVAVVADPAAGWTERVHAFMAAAARRGITIAGPVIDPTRGNEVAELAQLSPANPQALVLLDPTPDARRTLMARARLHWRVPVNAAPIATDASGLHAAGGTALAGVEVAGQGRRAQPVDERETRFRLRYWVGAHSRLAVREAREGEGRRARVQRARLPSSSASAGRRFGRTERWGRPPPRAPRAACRASATRSAAAPARAERRASHRRGSRPRRARWRAAPCATRAAPRRTRTRAQCSPRGSQRRRLSG